MVEVKCATSFDERFDVTDILNKDNRKFWVSTGLYPQEILLDLGGAKPVNEVKFSVTGARKIAIDGCKTTNASDFKRIGESKELTGKGNGLQSDSIRVESAPYSLLKFIILEGNEEFSSVHNIELA